MQGIAVSPGFHDVLSILYGGENLKTVWQRDIAEDRILSTADLKRRLPQSRLRAQLVSRPHGWKNGDDMTEVLLRAAEALSAGAGSSDLFSCGIDFRLERTNHDEWQVTVVSPRARAWLRDELCCPFVQCFNDVIRADALSANTFVKQAHAKGFRTEFVGLNGKDVF